MTIYTVINSNNGGIGSLRWAINQANANPGLDTIDFNVDEITLTNAIDITDSVDLNGDDVTITQTRNRRLFNINDNSDSLIDVSFNDLTLVGGKPAEFGGAILTRENLIIDESVIRNNLTTKRGGGIYSEGAALTITNSLFEQNEIAEGDVSFGGAVYVKDGTVDIRNTTFTENKSNTAVVSIIGGENNIVNSKFDRNDAGAISISTDATATIELAEIRNNASQFDGGGIAVADNSEVTVSNSILDANQSENGAGIFVSDSKLDLSNSGIINNNASVAGGGLYVTQTAEVTVGASTVAGNISPSGSGIQTEEDGAVAIENATVADNTGSENQLEGDNISFAGGNTGGILNPAPVTEEPITEPSMDLVTIDRFFQFERGFHFYTADANESQSIQTRSQAGELSYSYENSAYTALGSNTDALTGEVIEGAKPVYRLYNTTTGAHRYTMDENENDYIQNNLDNYTSEGVAYYAFESNPAELDTIPVYRMLNGGNGTHLFSADQNEVNFLQDSNDFSVEGNDGVAFYVFGLPVE